MRNQGVSTEWSRTAVTATVAVLVAFGFTRYGQPTYIDNEVSYLVGPIKLLHPEFLADHPFITRFNPFFWLFDLALAPFYLIPGRLAVTIVLRTVVWVFQVWALSRLARILGLAPWATVLAVVLWLGVEQTLAAGEWVVGSLGSKPVSYGFVFLALEALLRRRWTATGVLAGLAVCMHVLVGGWALLGLGVGVAIAGPRREWWSRVRSFAIPAGLLTAVGVGPGLVALWLARASTDAARAAEAARVYVEWANPLHLDPRFFLTGWEWLKLPLYVAVTLWLARLALPRNLARPVMALLSVAAAVFAAGLLAREVDWFGFLAYYPFRAADALFPLLFWLLVALLVQRLSSRAGRLRWAVPVAALLLGPTVLYLNNLMEPRAYRDARLATLPSALAHTEPRPTAYMTRETGRQWLAFLRGTDSTDLARMERWIAGNTEPTDVIIVPPGHYTLGLNAGRIEFISFKTFAATDRILDWKARFEALNGGPFRNGGWGIVQELRASYPSITPEQLEGIRREYGTDYIMTPAESLGALPLVHREGGMRLFRIVPPAEAGAMAPPALPKGGR